MNKIKSVRFIHNVATNDLPLRGFMDSESLAINLRSRALIYADQQEEPKALAGDFAYDPASFVGNPALPSAPPMEQLISNLNQILTATPAAFNRVPIKHINIWQGDAIKLMKYTGHVLEYMEREVDARSFSSTATASIDALDLSYDSVSDLTGLTDGDIVPSEPYLDIFPSKSMVLIRDTFRKLENGDMVLGETEDVMRVCTSLSEGEFVLDVCVRYVVYQSGVPFSQLKPAEGHASMIAKRYIVDCRSRPAEAITGESDEVTIY